MASTSKNWTGTNSWVSCRLVVSATANTAGNYSDVTATLYGARNDGGTSYNASSSNFWININGTRTSRTSGCTVSGTGWTQVHKQTTRVSHNDDGTKTITISAGGGITESSFQMGSNSVSLTLDKIARKSTMTIPSITLGSSQTLTVTRQSTSYTHTITYACGSYNGTIASKSSETSIVFVPSLNFANTVPNGTSVIVTYTIETFNGSTSLGSNSYDVSCSIPNSIVPTVSFTIGDSTGYAAIYDGYIQRQSCAQIEITTGGSYGSTISSCTTSFDGKTYTARSITTDPIVNAGMLTATVTVVDSRGRTNTATKQIQVLAYEPPKITAMTVRRCEPDGTSSSSGAYAAVTFSASILPLNTNNSATYRLKYKKASDSTYTTVTIESVTGIYQVADTTYIFSADTASSYDVLLEAIDNFSVFTQNGSCSSSTKVFSILSRGMGFAFGKVAELENYLEVAFSTIFHDIVKFTKNITLAYNAVINMEKSNGTARNVMYMNGDSLDIGHGGYDNSDCSTAIYGNSVSLTSKGATTITTTGMNIVNTGNFNYKIPYNDTGDCNTLINTGQYYIGGNGVNRPVTTNGWLESKCLNAGDYVHQTFTTYTGLVYQRTKQAGTWDSWIRTGGFAIKTYSWSGSWAKGERVIGYISTDLLTKIVHMSAIIQSSVGMYPATISPVNSSGAYAATWLCLYYIRKTDGAVIIRTGDTWSNSTLNLFIVHT